MEPKLTARPIPGVAPFAEYAPAYLRIRTKRGTVVPFRLNRAQLKVEEAIAEARAEFRPVRLLILKARQLGFSTWSLGRMYEFTTTNEAVEALMAAHEDTATADLFERARLMHQLNPDPPMTRYSSKTELDFSNPEKRSARKNPGLMSKIRVATAGKKGLGRSRTLRYFHGSEVAFWPDAATALLGVEQSLPDDPGTTEILESTANGVGGEFYDRWKLAENPETRGDWRGVFFAWFEEPEYRRPLSGGVLDPIPSCVADRGAFEAEERELMALHNLDLEQANWRRWAIVNKCGNKIEKFRQEYPATPQEAFLTSGRPIFNAEKLRMRERDLRAAELRHKADPDHVAPPCVRGEIKRSSGRAKFVGAPDGPLWVYRWPEPGRQYVIGGDPCKGAMNGAKDPDRAALQVIDRFSWEQVAVWWDRVEAAELAGLMALLGYFYNKAMLVPEANDHGYTVCLKLQETAYPNLYLRQDLDELGMRPEDRIGWEQNKKTRPILIDAIDGAINDNLVVLNHRETIFELLTFVRDPKTAKAAADKGCHDDLVMALGLALAVAEHGPSPAPKSSRVNLERLNPDAAMVARDQARLIRMHREMQTTRMV